MKKWKKIRTIESHDYDGYYRVEKDKVITPGGKPGRYSVIQGASFSIIMPIDSAGNIWMVRQHRYPIDKISLEFPAGDMDGENPILAAKRELEEETSLISKDWFETGYFYTQIGVSSAKAYSFVAHNVKKIDNPRKDPMDKDVFKIEKYSISQIKKMITNNEITDGPTISAFVLALFQGELNRYEKSNRKKD